MSISKSITVDDISQVYEGQIPDYHPTSYLQTRLHDNMAFVAKDNSKNAIGFLIYNIWWGNCPFIELIKIHKSYQRQGIGLALLEEAKREIKSKGFKKLISSTEIVNQLGLGFHDKAGFKKLNSLDLPHGEEQFYSIDLNET
jgi:L-amino acid N-acyltransferase YncA